MICALAHPPAERDVAVNTESIAYALTMISEGARAQGVAFQASQSTQKLRLVLQIDPLDEIANPEALR